MNQFFELRDAEIYHIQWMLHEHREGTVWLGFFNNLNLKSKDSAVNKVTVIAQKEKESKKRTNLVFQSFRQMM